MIHSFFVPGPLIFSFHLIASFHPQNGYDYTRLSFCNWYADNLLNIQSIELYSSNDISYNSWDRPVGSSLISHPCTFYSNSADPVADFCSVQTLLSVS